MSKKSTGERNLNPIVWVKWWAMVQELQWVEQLETVILFTQAWRQSPIKIFMHCLIQQRYVFICDLLKAKLRNLGKGTGALRDSKFAKGETGELRAPHTMNGEHSPAPPPQQWWRWTSITCHEQQTWPSTTPHKWWRWPGTTPGHCSFC